jgi:hypothetical protein
MVAGNLQHCLAVLSHSSRQVLSVNVTGCLASLLAKLVVKEADKAFVWRLKL